jgi:hypothetical protein
MEEGHLQVVLQLGKLSRIGGVRDMSGVSLFHSSMLLSASCHSLNVGLGLEGLLQFSKLALVVITKNSSAQCCETELPHLLIKGVN